VGNQPNLPMNFASQEKPVLKHLEATDQAAAGTLQIQIDLQLPSKVVFGSDIYYYRTGST
jgi:hypothetical protein